MKVKKLSVFTFQPYIYKMEGYLPTKLTLHQKFNYSEFMAKCSLEKVNSDPLECSSSYKKCHILYVLLRRQEHTRVIRICVHTWDPQANRFGNRDVHPGYPICNAGQNLESRRQLLDCLRGPGKGLRETQARAQVLRGKKMPHPGGEPPGPREEHSWWGGEERGQMNPQHTTI